MPSLPISLPPGALVKVSLGDTISSGQELATLDTDSEHVVNLAQTLHTSARHVKHMLKKSPGDTILPGEVLAVKKGFLGLSEETVQSQVAGVIDRFDRGTGELVISLRDPENQTKKGTETILSPIEGVVSLCNNERIVIDTDKDVLIADAGIGMGGEGELVFLPDSKSPKEDELLLYAFDANISGKILAGIRLTRDVITKAIGLDVAGIIGKDVQEGDLEYFQSKNYAIPILILNDDEFHKLRKWKNKKIYCNGTGRTVLLLHI